MGGLFKGFQGGIGGDLLATLTGTLTNVKSTARGILPTGGIADKVVSQTNILGPLSRGETPTYPKPKELLGMGKGGGLGLSKRGTPLMTTPPGGNLKLRVPVDITGTTSSFRKDDATPGLTRRF